MKYELEKSLWTEKGFENMEWHDCRIHSISFGKDFELLFDIDYIFKWVEAGNKFKFWIAPCTWIFENVHDISFESGDTVLEIDNVSRVDPKRPENADYIEKVIEYTWIIGLHKGEFSFKSVGYKQYVRRHPILQYQQYSDLEERGGISFSKLTV